MLGLIAIAASGAAAEAVVAAGGTGPGPATSPTAAIPPQLAVATSSWVAANGATLACCRFEMIQVQQIPTTFPYRMRCCSGTRAKLRSCAAGQSFQLASNAGSICTINTANEQLVHKRGLRRGTARVDWTDRHTPELHHPSSYPAAPFCCSYVNSHRLSEGQGVSRAWSPPNATIFDMTHERAVLSCHSPHVKFSVHQHQAAMSHATAMQANSMGALHVAIRHYQGHYL